MNQSGLLSLFHYNTYANELVLDVAAQLNDDELDRQLSPSHNSVRQLLTHMMECEAYFLALCQERPFDDMVSLPSLDDIRRYWKLVAKETLDYLTELKDADLTPLLTMPFGAGTTLSRGQFLMQAFLHSHTHRGELSIILSLLGHPLPTMDIILFFKRASGQAE